MTALAAEPLLSPAPARWSADARARPVRHAGRRELAHIPGKLGLPVVGILPEALLDPLAFAERMYRRHGPIYRFWARGHWNVQMIGAEANELLLFDPAGAFSAHGGWGPLIEPFFPGALLVKDGADHRASRRVLGEAFRADRMAGYRALFAADIDAVIASWSGRNVDLYDEIKRLTLRIAASTFIGLPLESGGSRPVALYNAMLVALLAVVRSPWLSPVAARGFWAKARLERVMRALLEEKRARPGDDIFSRVIEQQADRSRAGDTAIIDSMIFLMAAAHDTMASALTSVTIYLAAHPEWRDRLRAEAVAADLGEGGDAAAAELPLHEMVFKETIRLNAPAPIVWRKTVREVELYGTRIPAGAMAGINPALTHRIASVWPEPLRFDPLRFTPEAEKARHRFAYVPFGGGIHKCLGMHFAMGQAKAYMVALLRRDFTVAGADGMRWYAWPNTRPRGRPRIAMG